MEFQPRVEGRLTEPIGNPNPSDFRAEPGLAVNRMSADWDAVSRDWTNRKVAVSSEWSLLTEEDIEGIDGNRRSLQERLQARYGWTPEESAMQIEAWLKHHAKRHVL